MTRGGRIRRAVALGALLGLGLPTSAVSQAADRVRLDRLAALGRLWVTVKHFHPALADQPIDWDSALVAAIPRVNRAANDKAFAGAVQGMLEALGDPATRVLAKKPPAKLSPTDPGPRGRWLPGRVWLVQADNYEDLNDFPTVLDRLALMGDSARAASAVIVDLRTDAGSTDPAVMDVFQWAGLDRALANRPLRVPSLRGRYHAGFVPMVGFTSGGYFSGRYTIEGARIEPADSTRERRVAFVISEASALPPVALALQGAGLGRIVMEGRATQGPATTAMRVGLGEGLFAAIRTTDVVYSDGRSGFVPDTMVAPGRQQGTDPALDAALALLNRRGERAHRPTAGPAEPLPERFYDETPYPSVEYRLLAAFRMWGAVRYFFPYRPLMGEDWDAVLRTFLPRLEAARDSLEYTLAVAEMWTYLRDSHAFVESSVLADYLGKTRPPVRLRMIAGQPVVYQLHPDSAARATGIRMGDVILTVNGERARIRMARVGRYIAASTSQAWERDATGALLRGPDSSAVTVTVRGGDGKVRTLTMPRSARFRTSSVGNRSWPIIRRLADDIGYVDLDRLTTAMVDSMFATLADTRAIVFDMRGYPNGTAWSIAPRLTERQNVPAARFYRLQPMWRDTTEEITARFIQTLPPVGGSRYRGLTVMLIDETTQSQAEHTGVFFRAANGTTFIGSPTAGANGDVTTLVVPGGIRLSFSGQGTGPVDGTQLQRVGLKPDVLVRPTLAGIRAGRDEVLERALTWVRGKLGSR